MHGLLRHKDKPQLTELFVFWKDASFCVSAQLLHNKILKTEIFPFFFFPWGKYGSEGKGWLGL